MTRRRLLLYPRKQLDIRWRDLAAAMLRCLFPGDAAKWEAQICRTFAPDRPVLVTFAVRAGFDLFLTPTLSTPPPPLGFFDPAATDPLTAGARASQFAAFTSPFNLTGQPAISLPLEWNAAGLPIGVQLVAAYGREDLLIRVAAALEAARPWAGRRPAIHA